MKKLLAFMMAFALCFMCLGTFGFENAVCTEDHSAHVLHAIEEEDDFVVPEYVFIEIDSAIYNELTQTMKVQLSIGSDTLGNIRGAKLMIQVPNRILGKVTIEGGKIFGLSAFDCAKVTKQTNNLSEITIELPDSDSTDVEATGYLLLEFEVNEGYFPISRTTYLSFSGYATSVDGYKITYDPLSQNATVYVCNHSHTEKRVSKQPTCLTTGEEEEICTICNCVVATKMLLITDHDFDYSKPYNTNINPYSPPSCTTKGYGSFMCKVCEKIETTTVPATGHTLGERFLRNGHYWQTCKVCNAEVYAENQCAHDADAYKLVSVVKQSTCSEAGVAVYKCPTCNQTEERALPLTEHSVSKWSTIHAATCTKAGTKTGTCAICKKSITDEIPATEHSFGEWTTTKAASCTEAGTQSRFCTKCEEGVETRPIEATGHSYGTWVTTKPATCVENGLKKCICTSCGSERTDIIPLAGHTYGAYVVTKEPTCTEKGIKTRTCVICSATDSAPIDTAPENHVYGEPVVIENKTCLTDGKTESTCVQCGAKKTDVDPAVGHVLSAPVVDGKISTKTCACGYQEIVKTVKGGVEKTLSCHAGSLTITGAAASLDYSFELNVMPMDVAANYKQYYTTFSNAYVYKLLSAGNAAAFTADMTVSVKLDSSFDGYEGKVVVLRNGAFYPVSNTETKNGEVTVNGVDLIGAEAIFVEKGEEIKPNFIIPIVITVATIAIAAIIIVVILSKKSKKRNVYED